VNGLKRQKEKRSMDHFLISAARYSAAENKIEPGMKVGALDALVQRGTFASRDPEWLKEFPETKAINAVTYVEKFDKRLPGFKGHYDMLSERCHPNSMGHNFLFSKLDTSEASVRFCDEREPARNGQMIFAALAPLPLVESMMTRLSELTLKVADLHHQKHPIVE
jgi:hypothetical protein